MPEGFTQLRPVETEDDFRALLHLESLLYANAALCRFPAHPQSAIADRWLFGAPAGVFRYAYMFARNGVRIGYVMAYNLYPGEEKFALNLLPEYAQFAGETLQLAEGLTSRENKHAALYINTLDEELMRAAKKRGFRRPIKPARCQMGLDLAQYQEISVAWENEHPAKLSPEDFEDRAGCGISPRRKIAAEQYEAMYRSEYYAHARDHVIRTNDGAFAGHLTWWIDETGQTASLETVATLPDFRRQGIMRRAIAEGLNMLKAEGIRYAYVSTSAQNPARFLYESVGFTELGKAYLFRKRCRN